MSNVIYLKDFFFKKTHSIVNGLLEKGLLDVATKFRKNWKKKGSN